MNNQNLLFEEYEPVKQILQIGNYFIDKYQKKEEKQKEEKPFHNMFEHERKAEMERLSKIIDISSIKIVKKRGITNQRQSIIREIQDIIESENGGKTNAKVLAMKLSHVPTEDLYFMKSQGKDYRARTGKPFSKYIYGSIKPKKLSTD